MLNKVKRCFNYMQTNHASLPKLAFLSQKNPSSQLATGMPLVSFNHAQRGLGIASLSLETRLVMMPHISLIVMKSGSTAESVVM